MKKFSVFFLAVMFLAALTIAMPNNAKALTITLGDQDFLDGSFPSGVIEFHEESVGEPSPFNEFNGSDFGTPFSASWTFSFVSGSYNSASLTLGIFDHDSAARGSQVHSFLLDSMDLTVLIDTAFESRGGTQGENNIYSLFLPNSVLGAFSDGIATFSLTLQGPGLVAGDTFPSGNAAGLDFARLNLSTTPVPEPATMLLLGCGLIGLVGSKRKFKK